MNRVIKNQVAYLSKNSFLSFMLCLSSVSGCTNIERVDTAKVKDLVQNSEIQRITPLQLAGTTNRIGKQLTDSLNVVFDGQKTMDCDVSSYPFVKKLIDEYGIKVRLLGVRDTASTLLYHKEREIVQAYVYNSEQNLAIDPNVQKIGDSLFVYTAQASKKLQFSQQCFGNPANQLTVWSVVFPVSEVIKRLE